MPILRSVKLQNTLNLELPCDLLDSAVFTTLELGSTSFQPYQLPVLEQCTACQDFNLPSLKPQHKRSLWDSLQSGRAGPVPWQSLALAFAHHQGFCQQDLFCIQLHHSPV